MKTCSTKATGSSYQRKLLSPQFMIRQGGAVLAPLVLIFATWGAPAQGTVNFTMTVSGVLSTRVSMPDTTYPFWPSFGNTSNQIPAGSQTYSGALVAGSGFVAQLWAAPGANQPESLLQPASEIRTFRTGAASGTIAAGVATLTNIPPDTPAATLQMRVWQSGLPIPDWPGQFGWYYGVILGKSQPFNVEAIGGGTNAPPNLLNLRSFSLVSNLLDAPVSPLIYVQPQHQSVSPGGTASFTAETAGPVNKPAYWRFNGSNIVSAGIIFAPTTNQFAFPRFENAGGTLTILPSDDYYLSFPQTNVLQVTNVQPAQAGIYSLVVTNDCCPSQTPEQKSFAISSNAVLTVGTPGTLAATRDSHSRVVLNWNGVFLLQSATNVTGPFTDLPGPIVFGPYTNPDLTGPRFFRLRN